MKLIRMLAMSVMTLPPIINPILASRTGKRREFAPTLDAGFARLPSTGHQELIAAKPGAFTTNTPYGLTQLPPRRRRHPSMAAPAHTAASTLGTWSLTRSLPAMPPVRCTGASMAARSTPAWPMRGLWCAQIRRNNQRFSSRPTSRLRIAPICCLRTLRLDSRDARASRRRRSPCNREGPPKRFTCARWTTTTRSPPAGGRFVGRLMPNFKAAN